MTDFDIYTKEVEVDGKTLRLRPLDGEHLPLMWSILTESDTSSAMDKEDVEKLSEAEKSEMVKGMFTEENMRSIYKLCLHTMVRSYPKKDKEGLEDFTSLNLMKLFSVITDLNMNRAAGLSDDS